MRNLKNRKGQSAIEYMIIFSAVAAVCSLAVVATFSGIQPEGGSAPAGDVILSRIRNKFIEYRDRQVSEIAKERNRTYFEE